MTTSSPSQSESPDDAATPVLVRGAPSDVLRLIVASGVLAAFVLVGVLFGDSLVNFAEKLLRGLDALPTWLLTAATIAALGGTVLVAVAALVAIARTRAWRVVLAAVVAASSGASAAVLLSRVVGAEADSLTAPTSVSAVGATGGWGTAVLGGLAATVASVGPWLPRRWRQVGWFTVLAVAVVYAIGHPVSFDTSLALLSGWVAGSLVTVVAGSPSHRPSVRAITEGLAAVGLPLIRLDPASVDARGSTPYFGESVTHDRFFVKALGADERSADLMFRLYRRIQPRDYGDEKPFSSLRRAVEHEALAALVARDQGVRTPQLAAFAVAEPRASVLAYASLEGRSLDGIEPDELTDQVLDEIWTQLAIMRHHRIAHRDLRLANLFLDADGAVWIIDFGFAELAASDTLLANDLAEMLASSATVVGPERAVRSASDAIGVPALRTAIDRLALPYLSGATRAALKEDPAVLPALRARIDPASA
jgi:undecaprenyl-diphosphatase